MSALLALNGLKFLFPYHLDRGLLMALQLRRVAGQDLDAQSGMVGLGQPCVLVVSCSARILCT
jgi:hypothetical protein